MITSDAARHPDLAKLTLLGLTLIPPLQWGDFHLSTCFLEQLPFPDVLGGS